MIVREFYRQRKDGVNLFRTYSDKELIILQNETGFEYDEAIDVENAPYTYSETDKPIEVIDNGVNQNTSALYVSSTDGWTQEPMEVEPDEAESEELE